MDPGENQRQTSSARKTFFPGPQREASKAHWQKNANAAAASGRNLKAEARRSKSERRPKSEGRSPKQIRSALGLGLWTLDFAPLWRFA
jgi:hypothetical protein